MHEIEITIDHPQGLHLRPAALFVQTAALYASTIQVRNLSREGDIQNGKSALGIMLLRAAQGDTLWIQADGADAADAIGGLKRLIDSGFAEP